MANIRKSFNLRSGVQVDEDNLLVNSVGNVGLGTTVPTETLDVRGNIKVSRSCYSDRWLYIRWTRICRSINI